MRGIDTRLTIVWIGIVVIGLVFPGMCNAEIDPGAAVGIWLFDESAGDTARDSTGRGHDGKLIGGPKWVKGKFGGCLDFDGVDDTVEVSYSKEFDLDDFTIAAWIKVTPTPGNWQQIIMKQGAGSPQTDRNFSIEVNRNTGQFRGSMSSGDQTTAIGGQKVVWDEEWHHLAMTYDVKSLRIYVDGVLEAEQAIEVEPNKKQVPVTIGSLPGRNFTKGVIDEAAIFNVALGEEDINNIMNDGLGTALTLIAVPPAGKSNATWAWIKAQD